MKTVSKFFGLIALCAAAFASCQKEQVFEEDQLSDAVEEEGTRATSGREITLMTYNIAACSRYETNSTNPNKFRIFNDIANVIKATGAQYVSLNEVDYNNQKRVETVKTATKTVHDRDQLSTIQSCLGGNWKSYFQATIEYRDEQGKVGNGILWPASIKYVIEEVTYPYVAYEISPGNYEKYRGIVVIETNDCVFASTHLGQTNQARIDQCKRINDYFAKYVNCDKPVFLCGDFNAAPEGYIDANGNKNKSVYELLQKNWTNISGKTVTHQGNQYTNKCFDYIFNYDLAKISVKKNNLKVSDPKVINNDVIKGQYSKTNIQSYDMDLMSDHYPVVVTVKW